MSSSGASKVISVSQGGAKSSVYYQFGAFRVIPRTRQLIRDGEPVAVPPKAFEVLLVLVSRAGEIVSKSELMAAVWPDVAVEEGNLTQNIYILRQALGEGSGSQKLIVTHQGRGYSFVAPITISVEEDSPAPEPALPKLSKHRWPVPAALLFLAIIAVGIWQLPSQRKSATQPRLTLLTDYRGREINPAVSPDGALVAFAWDGTAGHNFDIYVKPLSGGGKPVRLTTEAARDDFPVWSPDGKWIAFSRYLPDGPAILMIPTAGGAERHVARVANAPHAWSSDGNSLAIVDRSPGEDQVSLFLIDLPTGARRRLTSPAGSTYGDTYPAFSPDGKQVAFVRSGRNGYSLMTCQIDGGNCRTILAADDRISSVAWHPSGRSLFFDRNLALASELSSVDLRSLKAAPVPGFSEGATYAAFVPAPPGAPARLVFTVLRYSLQVTRLQVGGSTGAINESRWTASISRRQTGFQYSPDGKSVAFISDTSGAAEIWISDEEGGGSRQLTSFAGAVVRNPRWSRDGTHIAVDVMEKGNRDIYVVAVSGGASRRLTTELSEEGRPSWSRDGQWIYFYSDRGGDRQIWRMPALGGNALQVTKEGGFEAFEAPDGAHLYYVQSRPKPGLWVVPIGGGTETLVNGSVWQGGWTMTDAGVYFLHWDTAGSSYTTKIRKIALDTGLASDFYPYRRQVIGGIAFSPFSATRDGRSFLICEMDRLEADLVLAERFEP